MKLLSLAFLFTASTPSFSTLELIEARADSAEMVASLFPDSPVMAAYQQGRAAGLREAVQIIRWQRSTEISSYENHTRNSEDAAR